MSRFSVIFDACVLYPAPLRDLLLRLAMTGLFNAKWTDKIHDEWVRSVLKNRPDLTKAQLDRTRKLMDKSVLEPKVENYEGLIPTLLGLPDPDDAHVLAAAIKSNSDAIVTYNLKDFPLNILNQYHVELIHPDDFIQYQIDLDSSLVCRTIKAQRASLKNPPLTIEEYLHFLKKLKLPQTALSLEKYKELI